MEAPYFKMLERLFQQADKGSAYKLKYVLDIAKDIFGTSSYRELFLNYVNLKKISLRSCREGI